MIRWLLVLPFLATTAAAEVPVSGYDYLLPETQALQDDDFANPGMLWVDRGASLWSEPPSAGPACAACHESAEETMRGVGAVYPRWSEAAGQIISLEQQINLCRTERQGQAPLDWESDDLLALTAYIMHQSQGLPMSVATDGPAAAAFAQGEAYFNTPRGQLDLACADCHVTNEGQRLRGEVVSQGQVNGFPLYRQLWQDIGSVSRMIAWCNDAVRAEPLRPGTPEIVALELYLRSRGNELLIETPAVRR